VALQYLQRHLYWRGYSYWGFTIKNSHWENYTDEIVTDLKMTKSMAACKSFRPYLKGPEQVRHWFDILAAELFTRLYDDFDLNKRWPKTLHVIRFFSGF
jgi:hypothetical protein